MSHMKSPNPFLCGHEQSRFVELDDPNNNEFVCGACRWPIYGERLSCTSCGFNVHPFCSTAPESLSSLSVHPQHPLTLAPSGPPLTNHSCDFCLDPINGIYYTCQINDRHCNFDLHPFCAFFVRDHPPVRIQTLDPTHCLEIEYQPDDTRICDVCRKECGGFQYRCGVCSVDAHIECLVSRADEPASRPDTAKIIKPPVKKHVYPPVMQNDLYPLVNVPMLDPRHLLELKHHPDGTRFCDVCRRGCGEWAYRCPVCSIDAHVGCIVFPAYHQPPAAAQPEIRKRDVALKGLKLAVNVVGFVNGFGPLFST